MTRLAWVEKGGVHSLKPAGDQTGTPRATVWNFYADHWQYWVNNPCDHCRGPMVHGEYRGTIEGAKLSAIAHARQVGAVGKDDVIE